MLAETLEEKLAAEKTLGRRRRELTARSAQTYEPMITSHG
jgi:hypothetical protein